MNLSHNYYINWYKFCSLFIIFFYLSIDLDPEVQPLTDDVVGEEPTWHARGILKKPSFRDNSWKHHVDTMTSSPEMTSSPPEWTTPSPVLTSSRPAFNTFRVAKTRGEAAVVNRPSIILEETPMRPLSLDQHLDSGDAGDALESEAWCSTMRGGQGINQFPWDWCL